MREEVRDIKKQLLSLKNEISEKKKEHKRKTMMLIAICVLSFLVVGFMFLLTFYAWKV